MRTHITVFIIVLLSLSALALRTIHNQKRAEPIVSTRLEVPSSFNAYNTPRYNAPALLTARIIDIHQAKPCDIKRPVDAYTLKMVENLSPNACGEVHIRKTFRLYPNKIARIGVQEQNGPWHQLRFKHKGWREDGLLRLAVTRSTDGPPFPPYTQQMTADGARWFMVMPMKDTAVSFSLKSIKPDP